MHRCAGVLFVRGRQAVSALTAIFSLLVLTVGAHGANSIWVSPGSSGRLMYMMDDMGDRVLDYSTVGYKGGLVPLPDYTTLGVPTINVSPIAGDNLSSIQSAISQAAALPLQANGFRGIVQLAPGTYNISNGLSITSSGIIFRGSGQGADPATSTILSYTGTSQISMIHVDSSNSKSTNTTHSIVDKVVPVGATSFTVDTTAGYSVGDSINIHRNANDAWIHAIEMDTVSPAWNPSDFGQDYERKITYIDQTQKRVFFDAPLPNAIETQYGGGTLSKFTFNRTTNVGIENLRGDGQAVLTTPDDEAHAASFVVMNDTADSWARNITGQHLVYATMQTNSGSRNITLDGGTSVDPISIITGGRRYPFDISSSQFILMKNLSSDNGRHEFVDNAPSRGPNVFLDGVATHGHADSGPHRRWSTGTLWDNITTNTDINVQNRGNWGTSHGWAGANMVIWNSKAGDFYVQNPETAQNWLIGSTGTIHTGSQNWPGSYPAYYDADNTGSKVILNGETSLYRAQLNERAAHPYEIKREYWVGDFDGYVNDGASDNSVPVDSAWLSSVQAAFPGKTITGMDDTVGTAVHYVPFTFNFDAPGNRVTSAVLTMAVKGNTGSSSSDKIYIEGTGAANAITFSSLGTLQHFGTSDMVQLQFVPGSGSTGLDFLTDGKLNLAIGSTHTIDWADLQFTSGPGDLQWTGANSAVWNINSTQNWNNAGSADVYYEGDYVTFGDGPTNRNVSISGTLAPRGTTINNSAGNDYTIGGGVIAGIGDLTKSGAGTATLTGANTYTGSTYVTGGTLKVGNQAALGSATGTSDATYVTSSGTLDVNGFALGSQQERIFIAGAGVGGNGALVNSGGDQTNATRYVTLTGDATIGGTGRLDVRASSSTQNPPNAILDLAGFTLTKTGTNKLALVAAQVTDGNITVNQGTLSIETTTQVQGNGTITLNSGTTLQFYDNTNAGYITRNMVFNGITVDNQNRVSEIVDSNVIFGGDNTFSVGNSATNTLTLNGVLSETGGARALNKTGAGILVLSGVNTFSGDTKVSGGTLKLNHSQALGGSTLDYNTYGGTLSFGTLTAATLGGLKGGQSLALTNGSAAAVALTVGANNNSTTYSGVLSGGGSLTKTGSGITTLFGANTYTGATAVSGGTLALSTATTNNIASTPSITVNSGSTLSVTGVTGAGGFKLAGSQVLTNNGTVAGNVTVANGTTAKGTGNYTGLVTLQIGGTIAPGNSIGTTTMNSFSVGGGTLQLEINDTSSDKIVVSGGATFTGGAINLSLLNTPLLGAYDVLTAGTLTGVPTLNTTVIGNAHFSIDSAALANNIIRIDVVVQQIRWSNAGATGDGLTWEVGGNQNWNNFGTPDVFHDGDIINFNDNNNGHYNVTINGTVSPGGTNFINALGDYTLSGGSIAGTGSLTKAGNSALTISNSNSYSGGTTLNGGTINANAASALGSGAVNVNAGTLNLNVANAIASAAVNLSGGTLNIGASAALGSGPLNLNSGTLDNKTGAALTLSTNNAQSWAGSFTFAGTQSLNMGSGAVMLNGSPTVTVAANTLTIGGVISDGTGSGFTKDGAGTLALNGASNYSGATNVNGGILKLGNATSLGNTAGATNISGGTVDINGLTLNTTEQFNVSGTGAGGIGAIVNNGAGTANNNISRFTLTGDATIGGTGRWDFRGNSPSVNLAGFTLTKTGTNQISFVDANVTSGNIAVNQGVLSIEATSLVQGTGTITYGANTVAQFYQNTAGNVTRPMVWNAGVHIGNANAQSVTINSPAKLTGDVTFVPLANGADSPSSNFSLVWAGNISDDGTLRAVTKSGVNILTLSGANTFSGDTKITGGTLQLGNSLALAGSTLDYNSYGGTLSFGSLTNLTLTTVGGLKGNQSLALTNASAASIALAVGANDSTTIYSGVLSGSGSFAKVGAGTLTLTAVNTYSGNTIVDNGTLKYTANNTVTGLVFGVASGTPYSNTAPTLNLSSANMTASSFLVQVNNNVTPSVVAIGAGKTLTVNGAVTIGPNVSGVASGPDATNVFTEVDFAGDGSLVVNAGANAFTVGQTRSNADTGTDPQATLDLGDLANFSLTTTTGELRIGYGGNVLGILALANTSNTITTPTIQIGNSNNQNSGGTSSLILGAGTNTINANNINIGVSKQQGVMGFDDVTGSVTIAGMSGGSSKANITIGNMNNGTSAGAVSGLFLDGHVANINAATIVIAKLSSTSTAGAVLGTMTFDTGTLNVDNLQLAVTTNSPTNTNGPVGTFTFGGDDPTVPATGVMNVNSQFYLANRTSTSGGAAKGTLTINGGTVNSSVDIIDASTTGTVGVDHTGTLVLNGGTLNLNNHNIGNATNPVVFTANGGTLKNVNLINGTGGLAKTGTGTLTLPTADHYTGGTTVNGGILVIAHVGALGTGGLTINGAAAATLVSGLTAPLQLPSLTITGGSSLSGSLDMTDTGDFDISGIVSSTGISDQGDPLASPGLQNPAADVNAVPEPASVVLAVFGIAGTALAGVIRRKHRRSDDVLICSPPIAGTFRDFRV